MGRGRGDRRGRGRHLPSGSEKERAALRQRLLGRGRRRRGPGESEAPRRVRGSRPPPIAAQRTEPRPDGAPPGPGSPGLREPSCVAQVSPRPEVVAGLGPPAGESVRERWSRGGRDRRWPRAGCRELPAGAAKTRGGGGGAAGVGQGQGDPSLPPSLPPAGARRPHPLPLPPGRR